ncbi:MAG: hypothetical protein A3F54_02745 [Candidatus Kerfeldbacteria bacterium RIFCSPHIGHO2_12_FULL_48_17]|uniref:Outer membrane protein beta-barrel domain-containing protein n=1 Tax=Candidatus Kerfeldbacteria bacterium RIFCSPHIGHO2_12_FULL_48_17 TaxID=1798542 RepID=A0A1G2B4V3_9BACT|nr:MAG: hypothetical protein A3F54_02745 [Candidatus Kerfeldbacteria bacterium RIFCSPHIGHO2_12_FULL_48_17]
MKKYFVVWLLICLSARLAMASDVALVEVQTVWARETETFTPDVDAYLAKNISSYVGLFAFVQAMENWAQGYGGLTVAPFPWLELGTGVGLEQGDNPWRFAENLWIGSGPVSFLGIVEHGGSGWWYKALGKYTFDSHFSAGVLAQRFAGVGLYGDFRFKLGQAPLFLWTAPLYEWEAKNLTLLSGAGFSF